MEKLTTFSLEACQRIAEVLRDKTPNTGLKWCLAEMQGWYLSDRLKNAATQQWCPAFTLSDLDSTVWKALGEKLGWSQKRTHMIAKEIFDEWYAGGYEEASRYLLTILK